jgi:hypothetical protein
LSPNKYLFRQIEALSRFFYNLHSTNTLLSDSPGLYLPKPSFVWTATTSHNNHNTVNTRYLRAMLWEKALTTFIFLKALFATCSPIAPSDPAILINNGTTNGTLGDKVTTAMSRFEIGLFGCRHQYMVFYERWVAQVPGSWWKNKYHNNPVEACKAWDNALLAQRICGLQMTECWEMELQYPSGKPGWLHARFNTCIGPNSQPFEHAFQVFDIGAEEHMYHCFQGM